MSSPLKVFTTRPWLDHDQGLVWTITDRWYMLLNIVIGVSIGLVKPRIERITAHSLAWAFYARSRGHTEESGEPRHVDETVALVRSSSHQSKKRRLPFRRLHRWITTETIASALSVFVLCLGIAYAVAGTFVTKIPTDTAALSDSTTCDLWGLDDSARDAAQDADALVQGERESRAGQYAKDCYRPPSAVSLDQCRLFNKPYISTSRMEMGQQCPFVNETYCPTTGYTAVKFTTDLVDAKHIGINAKNAPKFNRTMMCVPLNMNPGFAEKISDEPGHWGHKFGPVNSTEYQSKYTFTQYGDPFTYDVRSYTMSTYMHVYSKAAVDNYWEPISALDIRPQLNTKSAPYSLTLMFINSCRIFYKQDSDDPIFPADRRFPDSDLWTNNDSRARPLACIDWIEVCKDEATCTAPYQDNLDSDKHLVFTRYALNKSTAFDAIEYRGAAGLDAQDKIKDDTSLPLSRDQWITESWSLFNTSLSRIQSDALDIANGTNWDKAPLYVPKTPTWVQGQLCRIFTFQVPKGYNNIRFWPTLGILLIPILFGWLGAETQEEFDEKQLQSGYFGDTKLTRLELYCRRTGSLWTNLQSRRSQPANEAAGAANTQPAEGHSGDPPRRAASNYGTAMAQDQNQSPSASASAVHPLPTIPESGVGSRAAGAR